jgi:putative hydrolase
MADVPPNGFEGLLGDLLKAMGGTPASAWFDAAKGLAMSVVADEQETRNPEPVSRIRLEELARVVAMHVDEVVGASGGDAVEPVTRAVWANAALTSWRPRLEPIVASSSALPDLPLDPDDPTGGLLARFAATMGPMFLGLQVGSLAGHLAERALGSSAFPLPWSSADQALVIVRNLDQFADDWSLDRDAVAAFAVARELAMRATYANADVAGRVESLLADATAAQMGAQRGFLERLTQADGPAAFQELLGDPEAFLEGLGDAGALDGPSGPEHDALNAAVTALAAYFDDVATTVAARVLGDAAQLAEAWHRHRTGHSKEAGAAALLFGLDLSRDRVELGAAFVAGVVGRAGPEALGRLAADPTALPTPAEIVAPGLWLARTSLPELDGPATDG